MGRRNAQSCCRLRLRVGGDVNVRLGLRNWDFTAKIDRIGVSPRECINFGVRNCSKKTSAVLSVGGFVALRKQFSSCNRDSASVYFDSCCRCCGLDLLDAVPPNYREIYLQRLRTSTSWFDPVRNRFLFAPSSSALSLPPNEPHQVARAAS